MPERQHEGPSGERPPPRPAESIAPPTPRAGLLALQQTAGNAAVARLVASGPALARAPGPPAPDAAHLNGMTLNELDAHARGQADWAGGLGSPEHDEMVSVLEYGRMLHGGATRVMNALGGMKVSELREPVKDGARRGKLTDYALHAGQGSPSVAIETSTVRVPEAEKTGEAVHQLDTEVGAQIIGRIFVQRADAPLLDELISKGYVADFIAYTKAAAPNLKGDDGVEIRSYLEMRAEGVEPVKDFVGQMGVSHVRNFHRFRRDALQGLKDANAIPPQSVPLTLILHTAEDHNGAFHRKSELSAVIMRPGHHAVMLEGATSLAEITGLIPGIAALGQGGKIGEAVVAGHGDARSVGMAIKPDGTEEAIDLNSPDPDSKNLLGTLMANMSTDPNARIVLAACLTGSDEVPGQIQGATEDDKRADVRKQIAANPSLRSYLRSQLPPGSKAEVVGSNVSIPFPTMVDPKDPNGPLTIISPENPQATAERLPFIRVANEPEGGLRAVLGAWADDPKATWEAVKFRVGVDQGHDLHSHMTRTLFRIVLNSHQGDPEWTRQASIFARAFDFLPWPGDACRAWLFDGMPAGHDAEIFDAIKATTDWAEGELFFMRLVTLQAQGKRDPAKSGEFVSELGKAPSLAAAAQYLDWGWIEPKLDTLVPAAAAPGVSSATGDFRLALMAAAQGKGVAEGAHVRTYLAGILGNDPQFPAALDVDALLTNVGSEFGVIEAVRPSKPSGGGGGGGGFTPAPNVDLDGKAGNDIYVEPMTRHGVVAPTALNVRVGPGMRFKILDVTRKDDRLYVIGKSGNWLAIEWEGRTRFVHSRFVDVENVADGDDAGP